jgi:hypothetical protein
MTRGWLLKGSDTDTSGKCNGLKSFTGIFLVTAAADAHCPPPRPPRGRTNLSRNLPSTTQFHSASRRHPRRMPMPESMPFPVIHTDRWNHHDIVVQVGYIRSFEERNKGRRGARKHIIVQCSSLVCSLVQQARSDGSFTETFHLRQNNDNKIRATSTRRC